MHLEPPSIADLALEQLRHTRLKRQVSMQVLIAPKLFFSRWRIRLYKELDMLLCLPTGLGCWDCDMHEPLILTFAFPFIRFNPWCIKGTPKFHAMSRQMQKLWKKTDMDRGSDLREMLLEVKWLPSMPEHVVCKVSHLE